MFKLRWSFDTWYETVMRGEGDKWMSNFEAAENSGAPQDSLQKQLGEDLKLARKALGLTQTQIDEMTGIDQTNVSAIERGQLDLTLKQLVRLADALGHDVSVLLVPRVKLPRVQEKNASGTRSTKIVGNFGPSRLR